MSRNKLSHPFPDKNSFVFKEATLDVLIKHNRKITYNAPKYGTRKKVQCKKESWEHPRGRRALLKTTNSYSPSKVAKE